MTGRERFYNALKGDDVDRPPIWLREGMELFESNNIDTFLQDWKNDDIYRKLMDDVSPHIDLMTQTGIGQGNRFLMIPDNHISYNTKLKNNERIINGEIKTSKGILTFINKQTRGSSTTWSIKPPADNLDDLISIIDMPFKLDVNSIKKAAEKYNEIENKIGEKGITRVFLSSPMVCISGAVHFEDFFIWSLTEKNLFDEMLSEITNRIISVAMEFMKYTKRNVIFTFGGSEQCTPPMMSPDDFRRLVTKWDGKIIKTLNETGAITTCHCHGKVKDAIPEMIKMGYYATDPVEPPPAGDVTWHEVKKLAEDKLTLMGNIEWDELEFADCDYIRGRIKEILSTGKRHTVISASSGPISMVSQKLADNYRILVDECINTLL